MIGTKEQFLGAFFFSLNLIVVSDAAPNPHNVTGASVSALPGHSSSTSSTSSTTTSSSSSSHSSSLPSYASHDRGTGAGRRQGNKNILGNIFLNKICVTPVSRGAGSSSRVPFYSEKTLLKWQGWLRKIMWIIQRSRLYFAKDKISTIYKIFSDTFRCLQEASALLASLSLALNIDKTGYELPHRH